MRLNFRKYLKYLNVQYLNKPKYFELLYFLFHFSELLKCDTECDTLSSLNYFIFCLIFYEIIEFWHASKDKYFHKIT
jgi:hypothetical protein